MAGNETDIITALEEEFFGPDFFIEQTLLDKIIACSSIEEFKALGLVHSAPEVQAIFAQAAMVSTDCKKFTEATLQKVFGDLRSSTNNSDFI